MVDKDGKVMTVPSWILQNKRQSKGLTNTNSANVAAVNGGSATGSTSGSDVYRCQECSYVTKWRNAFAIHKRTHNGEKPFKCPMESCDYASVRSGHLSLHMRSHTGERPYKCDRCDYSAADRSTLKRHVRIHTGEKPYKCPVCSVTFTQSTQMTCHLRNVHLKQRLQQRNNNKLSANGGYTRAIISSPAPAFIASAD